MKLEVYKITNTVNGHYYIGITNQGFQIRWLHHLYEARSGSGFPIHNAIRKHGEESFQIEVIETITEDKDYDYLKEREIYWIKELESYSSSKGYNLTQGGDGTFGRYHSDETKEKIRQKAIGRKVSDDSRKRMSESHKNREYDKDEMSKRAKAGNAKRWSNPEAREKAIKENHNSRPILKCSLEGEILEEFISVSEAARQINKSRQSLSRCVSGKAKTAYGYIWKYKPFKNEDYDSNITTD